MYSAVDRGSIYNFKTTTYQTTPTYKIIMAKIFNTRFMNRSSKRRLMMYIELKRLSKARVINLKFL